MATSDPRPPIKEKRWLGRLWKKIKTVFTSEPPSKSQGVTTSAAAPANPSPSTTTSAPAAPTSPAAQATQPELVALSAVELKPPTDLQRPITPDSKVDESPVPAKPVATSESQPPLESDQFDESKMRFHKAQAIFARYNLELTEADWDMRPTEPHERVPKNIRMRVRYTCHNCSTTFGHDRTCIGCSHRRCKECLRYPPKTNKGRSKSTKTVTVLPPARSTPTNLEGACHECQTSFDIGSHECPNCHHKICERCLKEATLTVENPSQLQHHVEGVQALAS